MVYTLNIEMVQSHRTNEVYMNYRKKIKTVYFPHKQGVCMNKYYKYCANVWLAECSEQHEKGDVIELETRHGKINEHIVHNLIAEKNGLFYYSITRADGFNLQERAKRKSEKYSEWADGANKKMNDIYKSQEHARDFLKLAEPIKVGHHSENKHRNLIKKYHRACEREHEQYEKAQSHEKKAEYWASRENDINLSIPESMEYYKYKLEKATQYHADLKSGKVEKAHGYSMAYANKDKKEAEKNYNLAVKLWG